MLGMMPKTGGDELTVATIDFSASGLANTCQKLCAYVLE